NLSPERRGAVFDVAADLEGLKVEVDSVDPVTRPAIQLSIVTENTLHEWWFDPQIQQLHAMCGPRNPASTSPGTDAVLVTQAVARRFTRGTTACGSSITLIRSSHTSTL